MWYPNRAQWWVIWPVSVLALLIWVDSSAATDTADRLVVAVLAFGALLVWRLAGRPGETRTHYGGARTDRTIRQRLSHYKPFYYVRDAFLNTRTRRTIMGFIWSEAMWYPNRAQVWVIRVVSILALFLWVGSAPMPWPDRIFGAGMGAWIVWILSSVRPPLENEQAQQQLARLQEENARKGFWRKAFEIVFLIVVWVGFIALCWRLWSPSRR